MDKIFYFSCIHWDSIRTYLS